NDRPLLPLGPQRRCLCLLNTADGAAMLSYGPVGATRRQARLLSDRIDRAWVDKCSRRAPMAADGAVEEETVQMRCGGCGSKISSDVLSAVLKRIDVGDDPRVLLGCGA